MSSDAQRAEIVVIGGGAVGCAVAYSLAKAGKTDVLLLEKEPTVAAVTTPQAAGLVGQVRNSVERTKLAMWSVETFSQLQRDEAGQPRLAASRFAADRACARSASPNSSA